MRYKTILNITNLGNESAHAYVLRESIINNNNNNFVSLSTILM